MLKHIEIFLIKHLYMLFNMCMMKRFSAKTDPSRDSFSELCELRFATCNLNIVCTRAYDFVVSSFNCIENEALSNEALTFNFEVQLNTLRSVALSNWVALRPCLQP